MGAVENSTADERRQRSITAIFCAAGCSQAECWSSSVNRVTCTCTQDHNSKTQAHARARRQFSRRARSAIYVALFVLAGLYHVRGQDSEVEEEVEQEPGELLQTKPIYTGLLRTIGDGTSHIVSFDPSATELMLKVCMREGESGRRPAEEEGLPDVVECLAEYKENAATSKSNPAIGGQAFDPINQYWFHANGEDGFASAYITGVNVLRHESAGQASVLSDVRDTSFTLTALEYNRGADKLYAVVTYSSGQHYVVAISFKDALRPPDGPYYSESPGGTPKEVKFEHVYHLRNATGVVPAISTLEPENQLYFMVVVEGDRPLLSAINLGINKDGNPQPCGTRWDDLTLPGCTKWQLYVPGVITALELDVVTRQLFAMMFNASGHHFMQVDMDTGLLMQETPEVIENATTKVAFGLSSIAPSGFGMEDELNDGDRRLATFSYMTRFQERRQFANETRNETWTTDLKLGELKSVSWKREQGVYTGPDTPVEVYQRNEVEVEPGLTFTSFVAQSTTIPVTTQIEPYYSHVIGGAMITVIGGPFVDAPTLQCRWTILEEECPRQPVATYQQRCRIFAADVIYQTSSRIICIPPEIVSPTVAKISVSLSGVVWSEEPVETFVFYSTRSTVGRPPYSGSSKGGSVVQVAGVNLNLLNWHPETSVLQQRDSRCQFGSPLEESVYMFDDQLKFNDQTCRFIQVGPELTEFCSFTCISPVIPHEFCLTGDLCPRDRNTSVDGCNHPCLEIVPVCPPSGAVSDNDGKCRALLESYQEIAFSLVIAGLEIPYGTFQYTAGTPPIVIGARFTEDVSGLIVEFDTTTDRGARDVPADEMVLQTVNEIFVDPAFTMGVGGYVTWPSRRRLIVRFGYNPTITSKTFVELRKFRIASAFDPYAFSEGIFLPDPIPNSRKPVTTAVIDAPRRISFCSPFSIDAAVSSGGVGRDLNYAWRVRVTDDDGAEVEAPWVATLNARLATLRGATIRVDEPNTLGADLTVCFKDVFQTCDVWPGYTYEWQLITYSWLFDEDLPGCGPNWPEAAWEDPARFVNCPATSFKSHDHHVECLKNDTSLCAPWGVAKTGVLDKPFPDVQILGPSTVVVQPMTELTLQGRIGLESLFECDIPSNASAGASRVGILDDGPAGQLLGTFSHSWRWFQINRDETASLFDEDPCEIPQGIVQCHGSRHERMQTGGCEMVFEQPPEQRPLLLHLQRGRLLEDTHHYFTLTTVQVGEPGAELCVSVKVVVDVAALRVRMFTGVLPTADDKEAIGGFKEGSNFGLDVGSAIAPVQEQVVSVRALLVNPRKYHLPEASEGLGTEPPCETTCPGQCVHANDGSCVPLLSCEGGGCPAGVAAASKDIACPGGLCYCAAGTTYDPGCDAQLPAIADAFWEDRYASQDITYEFRWACAYWELDAYRYWEPSEVFGRSPQIVTECACGSAAEPLSVDDNQCMAPWLAQSLNGSLPRPVRAAEANVSLGASKFAGKFANTFEFSVRVVELRDGEPTGREVTGTARFTAYYQLDNQFVSGTVDRRVNFDFQVDLTPQLIGLDRDVAYKNLVPGQTLLTRMYLADRNGARSNPAQVFPFDCPPGLPEEGTARQAVCWYEWEEIGTGVDLGEASMSGFPALQPISAQTLMRLNPPAVTAGTNFFIRLHAYISATEASQQVTLGWKELHLKVSDLPRNGRVVVTPECGVGLHTRFLVQAQEWQVDSEHLPLRFSFSYQARGCDEYPVVFTDFTMSPEHSVRLPFCNPPDGVPCVGRDPDYCSQTVVRVTVRSAYDAFISSETVVDVWRTVYSGLQKPVFRGEGASDSYLDCVDVGDVLNLQPAVDIQGQIRQMKQRAFVAGNLPDLWAYVRNLGNLLNNEREVIIAEYGMQHSIQLRLGTITDVVNPILQQGVLPESSEGFDQMVSALAAILAAKHVPAIEDFCFFPRAEVQKMTETVLFVFDNAKSKDVGLLRSTVQHLMHMASATMHCLLNPQSRRRSDASRHLNQEIPTIDITPEEENLQLVGSFGTDFGNRACNAELRRLDGDEAQIEYTSALASYAFRRASERTDKNFQVHSPELVHANGECGQVIVEMVELPSNVKKDLCVTKYHFDVAGFPRAMSGSFDTDGVSHEQYGVEWPLHSDVCPVMVKLLDANGNEMPEKLTLKLTFDLSHADKIARFWFQPEAPDRHSALHRDDPVATNEFAIHDVSFAGVCEQWGYRVGSTSALGSWHEAQAQESTKVFDPQGRWINRVFEAVPPDDQDFCQLIHTVEEAAPERLASGIVECLWSSGDRTREGAVLQDLFAVVAERADCAGLYSKNATLSTAFDFNIGQFEVARREPGRAEVAELSTRKVCDRCMRCGMYNDCGLGCDNRFPPTRQLDLCGYCGGSCFGTDTVLGEDQFGDPIVGTCNAEQCGNLYLRFLGGEGETVKKYFFNKGTCDDPAARGDPCTDLNTPDGTEVREETYPLDTNFMTILEDEHKVFDDGELTLVSEDFPDRPVTMHLCALNNACAQYVWEAGTDIGTTPRCTDLIDLQESCGIVCGAPTDYADDNIFCAGGELELRESFSGVCSVTYPLPAAQASSRLGTLLTCTGTPAEITEEIQRITYIPPRLYNSGRPARTNVFFRATFEEVLPEVYRKDIEITVLPVNTGPAVVGAVQFRVQEDRPTVLSPSTPGVPGLASVAIEDDAEFQEPHQITVVLTVKEPALGAIGIGASQSPPLCPGCEPGTGGLVAVMAGGNLDCSCAGGFTAEKALPWNGPGEPLVIHATTELLNETLLANLEYRSGSNLNDVTDELLVEVWDNGYADFRQSLREDRRGDAENLTASATVEIAVEKENDPPVVTMPDSIFVIQGNGASITGGHIVDFDPEEHPEGGRPRYEVKVYTQEGFVGVSFSKPNCSVLFPPLINLSKPEVALYVDARVTGSPQYSTRQFVTKFGLLVDGTEDCLDRTGTRESCLKSTFLTYDLTEYLQDEDSAMFYPELTMVLRLLKWGCASPQCDPDNLNGEQCDLTPPSPGGPCSSEGNITINAVPCWEGSLSFDVQARLLRTIPKQEVGRIFVDKQTFVWLEVPLDVEVLREWALRYDSRLCLNIEAENAKLNETIVFYGAIADRFEDPNGYKEVSNFGTRVGYQQNPNPELLIIRGRAWNCTGTSCDVDCTGSEGTNIYSPECIPPGGKFKQCDVCCEVNVTGGTGIKDKELTYTTHIDPANVLLEEIAYQIEGEFSNAQGIEKENVTVVVKDVTAIYELLGEENGWFEESEIEKYTSRADTQIKVIPIKGKRLDVKVRPQYSESWLNRRLEEGDLPTYVMLEDCGNRPVEDCEGCDAECPTKIEVLPAFAVGESRTGRFTVEIASRYGTITIPPHMREWFYFMKGTGYRDQVVRIFGFTVDIREALQNLVYHTLQDQSLQYKNQNAGKCSRPCFLNDIGPAKFENAKEAQGCEQSCASLIYDRVNDFNKSEVDVDQNVFLDSLVVTFQDNGVTGIGLQGFVQVLLYNVYSLAVNDNPCVVFDAKRSDGCRERCANELTTNRCSITYTDKMDVVSTAGLPFDLQEPVIAFYREDDVEPVRIGGMVTKPNDLYDSSRLECRKYLAEELARRSDEYVLPVWVSNCPQLNVRIFAIRGEVSLNNRENLNIYRGATSRFANEIAFIGHPVDCNSAMRMIQFRMSAEFTNFNSAQGEESVTFIISDQGHSGSDSSGEFDGSSATSTIVVPIEIEPVNDPPTVVVPRAADPMIFDEGAQPQLQSVALPPTTDVDVGLDVYDVDTAECGSCSLWSGTYPLGRREECESTVNLATGRNGIWQDGGIIVDLSVKYGRLKVVRRATPGLKNLPSSASQAMDFFLDPDCNDIRCGVMTDQEVCIAEGTALGCVWSPTLVCECQKVSAGLQCNRLKFRGPSSAVQEAISALQYIPRPYFNELELFDSEPEILEIRATDKKNPANRQDRDFYCGDSSELTEDEWVTEGQSEIRPRALNDEAIAGFFPAAVNPSFEEPPLCEGATLCDEYLPSCIGVLTNQAENWELSGDAGISSMGWIGDAVSPDGVQHLFLATHDNSPVATALQNISGFTPGFEYSLTAKLSARQHNAFGSRLNISLQEDPHGEAVAWLSEWPAGLVQDTTKQGVVGRDTWIQCRHWCQLSAERELVSRGQGAAAFRDSPTIRFVAHSPSYALLLRADRTDQQPGSRMVFVDDIKLECTRISVPEDNRLFFRGVDVLDPDLNPGVYAWKRTQQDPDLLYTVTLRALSGTFNIVMDDEGCTVMPPSDNANPDVDPNMIMTDSQRIDYGLRCNVSDWANLTSFRSPCPEQCLDCDPPVPFSWVGLGIPSNPCVRLPLTDLNLNWTELVPRLDRIVDTPEVIPGATIEFTGTRDYVVEVMRSMIYYLPNLHFNTDNRGPEQISFIVNDNANVEIPDGGQEPTQKISTRLVDVEVKAVNDAPEVSLESSLVRMEEGEEIKVTGVSIMDVDLDEVPCKDGVCAPNPGVVQARMHARNGTFILNPTWPVLNLNNLRSQLYAGRAGYEDETVQLCLWRKWCDDMDSELGQPTIGITPSNPCAELPLYHNVEECVEYKIPFCSIVRTILPSSYTMPWCQAQIEFAEFVNNRILLDNDEITSLKDFQQRLITNALRGVVVYQNERRNLLVMMGKIVPIRNAFDGHFFTYRPDDFYNGIEDVTIELNDLARKGIRYPCEVAQNLPDGQEHLEAPASLPEYLRLEHCNKTAPYVLQTGQAVLNVDVAAVNNLPYLVMYDDLGNPLPELQAVDAAQNQTMFLPKLEIVDVDIDETEGAEMVVEITVQAGGYIGVNASRFPALNLYIAPSGSRISATGPLRIINQMLERIEYKSDEQLIGIESMLFFIDDQGFTGKGEPGKLAEVFQFDIIVKKPPTCQYPTCETCTLQAIEACGWCPSSCNGVGKCRDATSVGGPPLFGTCEPLCIAGGCLGWNMCELPPNRDWMKGAIGAPLLLFALVTVHLFLMWARRFHGSGPAYLVLASVTLSQKARKLHLLPPPTASSTQIFVVAGLVVMAVMVSNVGIALSQSRPERMSLGEAQVFVLETDGCDVLFKSKPNNLVGNDQLSLSFWITANGTLSDVVVQTDSCGNTQYLTINNTRLESEKYQGYSCVIHFEVPQPVRRSTLPALEIKNLGTRTTTITQDPDMVLDLGPNYMRLSGSVITLDMFNAKVRLFNVDIQSGSVSMRNATFDTATVNTVDADITLSVSNDPKMQVYVDVALKQSSNDVCVISGLKSVFHELTIDNTCNRTCQNRTQEVQLSRKELRELGLSTTLVQFQNITDVVCSWSCGAFSPLKVIPYKTNPEPGLQPRAVELSSQTGEIQFMSVPETRVPPYSGRNTMDPLYVYDGLYGDRQVGVRPAALANLNTKFHPGGSNRPTEDYFTIKLEGPSRPAGYFVWVSNIRYLVLPRDLLNVLSIGMLVPRSFEAFTPLRPTHCPYFDNQRDLSPVPDSSISYSGFIDEFAKADLGIVDGDGSTRRKLKQTVADEPTELELELLARGITSEDGVAQNLKYVMEYYNVLREGLGLDLAPTNSYLAYRASSKQPFVVFNVDPVTGATAANQVRLSSTPDIFVLLILGLIVPALVGLVSIYNVMQFMFKGMAQYRDDALKDETAKRHLLDATRYTSRKLDENDEGVGWLGMRADAGTKDMIYKQTTFFYFLEFQVMDPRSVKSLQQKILVTLLHFSTIFVLCIPMFVFGLQVNASNRLYVCPDTELPHQCAATIPWLALLAFILCGIFVAVALVELILYYSDIEMNKLRWVIRRTFYTSLCIMATLATVYVTTIIVWIMLGVLVDPARFAPYLICVAGLIAVSIRHWHKVRLVQARVRVAVLDKVDALLDSVSEGVLPRPLLKNLTQQQVGAELGKQGLLTKNAVQSVFAIDFVLIVLYTFLFVGFNAFTKVSDAVPGIINSILTAMVVVAVDTVVNAREDSRISKIKIQRIVHNVLHSVHASVRYILKQVDIGKELVKKMKAMQEFALDKGKKGVSRGDARAALELSLDAAKRALLDRQAQGAEERRRLMLRDEEEHDVPDDYDINGFLEAAGLKPWEPEETLIGQEPLAPEPEGLGELPTHSEPAPEATDTIRDGVDGAALVIFEMEDDAHDVPTDPEIARQKIAMALGIEPGRLRVAIPTDDDAQAPQDAF